MTFISMAFMATTYLDRFSRARYTFPSTISLSLRPTVASRSYECAKFKVLNGPHPMIQLVVVRRLLPVPLWGERSGVHGIMMWSREVGERIWSGRE